MIHETVNYQAVIRERKGGDVRRPYLKAKNPQDVIYKLQKVYKEDVEIISINKIDYLTEFII